jgi:ribose 5-phosphate isomerase A
MSQDDEKRKAAEAAAALVEDGMIVGLGSGSTAAIAIEALGRRGLRIVGVPTSEKSADLARSCGIRLTTLAATPRLDLTIDGADEIEIGTLALVKGRGGALLREKIVAAATDRLVIVADESKVVERLSAVERPIPIEVVPFGWETTAARLGALGAEPKLRDGFLTDGGHFILDCLFPGIEVPALLAPALDATVGVIEHGLFLGMASQAMVASESGLKVLRCERRS